MDKLFLSLVLVFGYVNNASAKEVYFAEIVIENHKFHPNVLELPKDVKVKLKVINKDPTPEEFESIELKREKVVSGNSDTIISFGPLKPGEYKFFGEFHEETAQGKIVVKE
ncbi:MAG: cupredoxin domain-containing protein [Alphaproteobacteria bacterium]|nr:cupredoxin domain-containing protein [Alphaproteobacteria bacterium]OJV12145.1 MAG: hypothetical protein BGO27_05345 [Alphaproteobacteria bacterium 33-17]